MGDIEVEYWDGRIGESDEKLYFTLTSAKKVDDYQEIERTNLPCKNGNRLM